MCRNGPRPLSCSVLNCKGECMSMSPSSHDRDRFIARPTGMFGVALLAIVCLSAVSAFAATQQRHQDFTTDPGWERGGVQDNVDGPDANTDSDLHDFGWRQTDFTGTAVAPPVGAAT